MEAIKEETERTGTLNHYYHENKRKTLITALTMRFSGGCLDNNSLKQNKMIEIKYNIVGVNFAENKNTGVICTGVNCNQLILQQLSKPVEVGTVPNDVDIIELPKIVMQFNCVESVDVMIKALEQIRMILTIPLAC